MKDQITFEEIKEIIDLIRKTDNVSDFTLKCGDVEISLSRGGSQKAPAGGAQAAAAQAAAQGTPAAAPADAAPPERPPQSGAAAGPKVEAATAPGPGEGEVAIKSPMVGTFYRCPKPGDPPFVEVGQSVREDTVLCIIEVMKLMNSIEAKVKGTVTRILIDDAQPVQHGEPLMYIKVDGS